MKQYRMWALDVPDLDPRGFTHCGNRKIRLYDGGDGGGGGDGGEMDQAAAEAAMDAALAAEAVGEGGDVDVGDTTAPEVTPDDVATVMAAMLENSASGMGGLGNIVSDAFGGGWQTGGGPALGSAGLNISLGLDPNAPTFDPFTTQLAPENQMTLEAAAQALGMSPQDLAAVQAQTGFVAGVPSMVSTTGLDLTTLNQLSEMGLGSAPVSNTQTVDQAIAALNAHAFLNENIGTIMGMMVPGAGAMISGTQALGGLLSGVLTPGQALGHVTGLTPMNEAQLATVVASPTDAATGVSDVDTASGGSGNEVVAAPAAPLMESESSGGFGGLDGLAALALLSGIYQPQEKRMQDIQTVMAVPSPFGEGPYGLRDSIPYA